LNNEQLRLTNCLRQCFRRQRIDSIYRDHRMVLLLVVHILLGYRKLNDLEYYRDDPMVKRESGKLQCFISSANDAPP